MLLLILILLLFFFIIDSFVPLDFTNNNFGDLFIMFYRRLQYFVWSIYVFVNLSTGTDYLRFPKFMGFGWGEVVE